MHYFYRSKDYEFFIEQIEKAIEKDTIIHLNLDINERYEARCRIKIGDNFHNPSQSISSTSRLRRILKICNKGYIRSIAVCGRFIECIDFSKILKGIKVHTLNLKKYHIWFTEARNIMQFIKNNCNVSSLLLSTRTNGVQEHIENVLLEYLQHNKHLQYIMFDGALVRNCELENRLKCNRILNRSLFGLCSTRIIADNNEYPGWFPPIVKEQIIEADDRLL